MVYAGFLVFVIIPVTVATDYDKIEKSRYVFQAYYNEERGMCTGNWGDFRVGTIIKHLSYYPSFTLICTTSGPRLITTNSFCHYNGRQIRTGLSTVNECTKFKCELSMQPGENIYYVWIKWKLYIKTGCLFKEECLKEGRHRVSDGELSFLCTCDSFGFLTCQYD